MRSKLVLYFVGVLLVLAIGLGIYYQFIREDVPEGTVDVVVGDVHYYVQYKDLTLEKVEGIRVNGKGEELPVKGEGILLSAVLDSLNITDFTQVVITSADAYSATVTHEEIKEPSKAYLLLEEEGLRLIVFGDTNSKRSVSGVVQITVE